ncbi:T9SS type A sorting domain-containing protein [Catalinimonas alkaloidigena]|nr:T9SS type A sorting domain-containing protein [Catalinimonas alkaloidigena]
MRLHFLSTCRWARLSIMAVLCHVLTQVPASAQRLYGTTENGGTYQAGQLYSMNKDGSDFRVELEFPDVGYEPTDRPLVASDGTLYTVTSQGGQYGYGSIVRTHHDGSFALLYAFRPQDGRPQTGLQQGRDGNFYGFTATYFYRISPQGKLVVRRSLPPLEGQKPLERLVRDPNGFLYGVAAEGGKYGWGTAFRLRQSGDYKKLRDFHPQDGGRPVAAPIRVRNSLYGTTTGTVYRLDFDGTYRIVHRFAANASPLGGVVLAGDGYLYGLALVGYDVVVYRLAPSGSGFLYLNDPLHHRYDAYLMNPAVYDISEEPVPGTLIRNLTIGYDGRPYGYTFNAAQETVLEYDPAARGTIFKIDASNKYHYLQTTRHERPFVGLTYGPDGKFYVATDYYTSNFSTYRIPGQLVCYAPDGARKPVHGLGFPLGKQPDGNSLLLIGQSLYGTAQDGGISPGGLLFRYDLTDATYQILQDFTFGHPKGNLLYTGGTYLYGTIAQASTPALIGASGNLFRIRLDGSGYQQLGELYPANDGQDFYKAGFRWQVGLSQGKNGSFYTAYSGYDYYNGGYTSFGGSETNAIRFDSLGNQVQRIGRVETGYDEETYNESIENGFDFQGLTQAQDGYLYALASRGGTQDLGALVRFSPDGSEPFRKMLDFADVPGESPQGKLLAGRNGYLYGITATNVFRYHPGTAAYQSLHALEDGIGNLYWGQDGYLYGSTRQGVFRLRPDGSGFQQLYTFAAPVTTTGGVVLYEESTVPPVMAPLALEAECAQFGSAWQTNLHSTQASQGGYIFSTTYGHTPQGKASHRVRFQVDIANPGAYQIAARVKALSTNRNSFWVRVNDGPWTLWNGLPTGEAYQWSFFPEVHYTLPAGVATIDLEFREPYTQLDKLLIGQDLELPEGEGPQAHNCGERRDRSTQEATDLNAAVQVYPNPTTGRFHVVAPTDGTEIRLMDIRGQQLRNVAYQRTAEGWEINLQQHPAGIYLLQVQTAEGLLHQRIVKQ